MMKNVIRLVAILAVLVMTFATVADAYSYTVDDATDYDWADGVYSIWAFDTVTASTDTGATTARGWNGYAALHTCTLWIGMEFTATSTGQAYCSAEMSTSWKLIAGTAVGAYAYLDIYLVLMNSARSTELDSELIFTKHEYCSSGEYEEISGTDYVDETEQWSYTLQSSTTYYAVVKIYIRTYNGGYAFSYSGTHENPTALSVDVAEISVYT